MVGPLYRLPGSPVTQMSAPLVAVAPAKINLCFEVLGARPDGLHEVATVLQTISLADRLTFVPSTKLTLACTGMKATPDNLMLRAARMLQQHTGTTLGCAMTCEKHIPLAAGLGGGSTDAASTLRMLNRLWGCDLDASSLVRIAAELGADVPFFLYGGTALATGSGRDILPLPDAPSRTVLLVPLTAASDGKTREMYAALVREDFGDGHLARAQADAIRRGTLDSRGIWSSFSRPALERWPATRFAIQSLANAGALATVTGAGPSVFALFESESAAEEAAASHLKPAGLRYGVYPFTSAHAPT